MDKIWEVTGFGRWMDKIWGGDKIWKADVQDLGVDRQATGKARRAENC